MFLWKGHECLIICVIDAAVLFVSNFELLSGRRADSVHVIRPSGHVTKNNNIHLLSLIVRILLFFNLNLPGSEWTMKTIQTDIQAHYQVYCVNYRGAVEKQDHLLFFFLSFFVKRKVKAFLFSLITDEQAGLRL